MVRKSAPLCRFPDYAAKIRTKSLEAHTNVAAAAHACVLMRHSPEGKSELFQECQQFVVGLKTFGSPLYGVGFSQGLFFQC